MMKNNRGRKQAETAHAVWEPRKAEIQWLYHECRWSVAQIASYYNVSQTGMGLAVHRLGIKSRGRGRKGKENGRYKDGTQSRLYRQMIQKDRCTICGSTERLVVHHKNGDHYDNHLENLAVLCESCHNRHHRTLWWERKKTSGALFPIPRTESGTFTAKVADA